MYDQIKTVLSHCINVVVGIVLLLLCTAYLVVTSAIVTRVVNELRLDTYLTWDTGFGIVTLVLLLVWAPLWLLRSRPPVRYSGKL